MWNELGQARPELLSLIERECFDRRKNVYSRGVETREPSSTTVPNQFQQIPSHIDRVDAEETD